MLTIYDQSGAGRDVARREFLRVGTAAVGGLSLAHLLTARALCSSGESLVKDRSVVVLNLQGGPTQFELFDPKMEAPREIRSITGEIKTTLSGVTFGGTLPKLAGLAHKLAVVRSYRHGISSHGQAARHVMAGGNKTGAMFGALYARVAGLTDARTAMPRNVLVTSHAMGAEYRELNTVVSRVSQTGTLAPVYKPLDLSTGAELVDDMKLHVDGRRIEDRRALLRGVDQLRRRLESVENLSAAGHFQEKAFDVLLRGVSRAFDISDEPASLLERYDTGRFVPTEAAKRRNSYAAQFSPVALGRQLLLARRLCEAGCGFVTVTQTGWDMHGGGNELTMKDGVAQLTPAFDKAVSAFIEDVAARGLEDRILLVITGEFGRTPRINRAGGRDHWGSLCPIVFVGGGLNMGQVVGKSDRSGARPASRPITSEDVRATILHTLLDIPEVRVQSGLPPDVFEAVTEGRPIPELV